MINPDRIAASLERIHALELAEARKFADEALERARKRKGTRPSRHRSWTRRVFERENDMVKRKRKPWPNEIKLGDHCYRYGQIHWAELLLEYVRRK